jgi:apolipoprotein N-acyltransferase
MQSAMLAALSGLLLATAYPPVPTGVTAFVALVPLLFLMERMRSLAQTFRYSYLAFLVLSAGTTWWISGWWGQDPWLKASGIAVNLVHPVVLSVPLVVYVFIRRRLGSALGTLSFPFVWTAWEWLFHFSEISFPWLLLANTQTYDIEKVQFISVTGAFGASFWIASVNAGIFYTLRQYTAGKWGRRSRRLWTSVTLLLLALLLPELHGRLTMGDDGGQDGSIRVGIVQPDIDPYEKWLGGDPPLAKLQHLIRPYDSLASEADLDLILLPETAIPFRILLQEYHSEWQWLRSHVDSVGVPLLAGFPDLRWYYEGEEAPPSARRIEGSGIRYESFNSTMLVRPGEARPQIYHKSKLTPMSERIPWIDTFPFLSDLLTWGVGISSWGLGNDTTTFALGGALTGRRTWAMICYETLYPGFVAGFVRRGSNMLCVVTNDGWFGNSPGPYQLERYTVLRAIENRRAVARCANNGISCFIDPWGRISGETRLYTRTTIRAELPLRSDLTFYTRFGDWFPFGVSICAGFLLLASFIVMYYRKPRHTV